MPDLAGADFAEVEMGGQRGGAIQVWPVSVLGIGGDPLRALLVVGQARLPIGEEEDQLVGGLARIALRTPGAVARELRAKNFMKIISLASEVV